ncbi:MAG TPA: acetyl-CoA carboxylase carboxyltransferase subunit alpha [Ktedonobacterales bacterium]|nr:acetyl-CoA carboxylase carboxyltransferase subunit alpha [Ktedonobacterales bacterium]
MIAFDLDFERPLADLDKRIQALQKKGTKLKGDDRVRLNEYQQELNTRMREIYSNLTPWQSVQVARHPRRPYTADYIELMTENFFELRGDRRYGDDRAILGGLANLDGQTIVILGNQKGRDTKERMECNFGMSHPEGYRKVLRLLRHAERFHLPVVTLVDIPGASPGLEDEQRGIAQAIAENLMVMAALRTPIITVVIGEGGSGGALGISVSDRILMLEHSIYTVASPEAAAAIMWRDAAFAPNAAEAMKITSKDLKELGLIEEIIPEPMGGAHQNKAEAATAVKAAILRHLAELRAMPTDKLLDCRYRRYRGIGLRAIDGLVIEAMR